MTELDIREAMQLFLGAVVWGFVRSNTNHRCVASSARLGKTLSPEFQNQSVELWTETAVVSRDVLSECGAEVTQLCDGPIRAIRASNGNAQRPDLAAVAVKARAISTDKGIC